MKFSNILFALFLLLIVSACANNQAPSKGQSPKPEPKDVPAPIDLSLISLPEVLSTKYDSVILRCNLWTKMRGPLVITDTPDDTVSVDLLKDSNFPKIINLAAKSEIHSLDIEIKLNEIKIIKNSAYSDNYGARYSFTNSPAIYGEYSGQASTIYPNGYTGGLFQSNNLIISENIINQIIARSSGSQGEANPSVDYVECALITKAKPQYKDEWKQESTGFQPSCLLGTPVNPNDCMIRRN